MIDRSKHDLNALMANEFSGTAGLRFLDACLVDEVGIRFRAISDDHPGEKMVVYIPWTYQDMSALVACKFKSLMESRPKNLIAKPYQVHAQWIGENE